MVSRTTTTRPPMTERAALVGLMTGVTRRLHAERSLDELAGLAEAAGAQVRRLREIPVGKDAEA